VTAELCPRCGRTDQVVSGRCPECGWLRDPARRPPPAKVGGSPLLPEPLGLVLTGGILIALVVLVALGELVIAAIGLVVLLLVVLAVFGGGLW
jgi:hypothetical protein